MQLERLEARLRPQLPFEGVERPRAAVQGEIHALLRHQDRAEQIQALRAGGEHRMQCVRVRDAREEIAGPDHQVEKVPSPPRQAGDSGAAPRACHSSGV